jgi:amidohydrolase
VNEYLPEDLSSRVKTYADELSAFRRDLHAHPELGRAEVRTTRVIRQRLEAAGLAPTVLPGGTGLICDIGQGETAVGFRADIDALPVADEKTVPYRSTVPGVCHACGHDIHAAVLLGAGLVLADLAREGLLQRRVRLIFQPAEELMPGGALDVIEAHGIDRLERIFTLHCDPKIEVGLIGLRTGPVTSACDRLAVRLLGPGGHTARPHLTADLVYALAKVVTELPAALSRRIDPRAGLSLVWGRIAAGAAANAIPQVGEIEGTIRCLDLRAWQEAPEIIPELVEAVASTYGAEAEVGYHRGVPPVVNDPDCTALLRTAGTRVLGPHAVVGTEQSLGGEDFAWFLERVPGALVRLGVRAPGDTARRDLHQGTFDAEEGAIPVGVNVFVATALLSYR